jgi:ParB-like chromosome segregation protein Spo0J
MNKSAHKAHPAAELFPLMGKDELRTLADDIKKNGLASPIVRTKDGVILDGRNRLAACEIAGVKPRFEEYTDNDPVAFIVSANIHRRHLTSKQKGELVAKLLKLDPEKSDRQIGATAKVDHKTVRKERRKAEASGEIPHLKKTKGRDGRSRPATKPVRSTVKPPATPTVVNRTIGTQPNSGRESERALGTIGCRR